MGDENRADADEPRATHGAPVRGRQPSPPKAQQSIFVPRETGRWPDPKTPTRYAEPGDRPGSGSGGGTKWHSISYFSRGRGFVPLAVFEPEAGLTKTGVAMPAFTPLFLPTLAKREFGGVDPAQSPARSSLCSARLPGRRPGPLHGWPEVAGTLRRAVARGRHDGACLLLRHFRVFRLSMESRRCSLERSEKGPSGGEERAHTRFGGRKHRYADTALVALDLRRVGIIIGGIVPNRPSGARLTWAVQSRCTRANPRS
jgi:hypothetical protein